MNRFIPQERGIIVSIFLRNNSSVVLAQGEFRRRFPGRPTPPGQALRRLATRIEETGTTRDAPKAAPGAAVLLRISPLLPKMSKRSPEHRRGAPDNVPRNWALAGGPYAEFWWKI